MRHKNGRRLTDGQKEPEAVTKIKKTERWYISDAAHVAIQHNNN